MPTQLLPFGTPVILATNVVYALPGVKATVFCGDTTPAIEQSNLIDFSTKVSLTLTGGLGTLAGGFVRATAGTPLILLSRD